MTLNRRPRSAFTIVELLIAAAISVLIVVMLGTMLGSLTKAASHGSQRIDAFRDARGALQLIERDLTGIVRATPTAYFALDDRYTNDPNTITPKNRQLYAIVSAKNSGTGNLCAVGYYCRWDTTRHTYSLRRYFRNSNELMADDPYFSNQSRITPPWNIRANGAGTYMRSDQLYQPSDTDAPAASPPTFKDDVLASYVWNFQITAYKSDGTIDTTYPLIIDPSNPSVTMPAAIEISFNAISPEAARTLLSLNPGAADWMDPTAQKHRLLTPHTYEFRTRINL